MSNFIKMSNTFSYIWQANPYSSHFFFFWWLKTLLLNLFNYIQFTNDLNKNNSEQELYTKYVGKSKKQSYNIHWIPLKHACNSKGGKTTHYKSLKSNFPFTKETKDFSLIHILLNLSAVKRSLSAFTRYLIWLTIHERITSQLCVFDWKTWRHLDFHMLNIQLTFDNARNLSNCEIPKLHWPGIEPGTIAWKATMLTTTPPMLLKEIHPP